MSQHLSQSKMNIIMTDTKLLQTSSLQIARKSRNPLAEVNN